MRSLITVVCFMVACNGFGQGGYVDFSNDRPFHDPADRLVRFIDGRPLTGTNYVAELYYGTDLNNLIPTVPARLSPFRAATTRLPGTWSGSFRTISGVSAGTAVFLKAKVWDNRLFPNGYDSARTNGGFYGESEAFTYRVSQTASPSTNTWIHNFRGFKLTVCSNGPPHITVQPKSQISLVGGDVTFEVCAAGSCDFGYQWRFNGSDVPDATNSTFTVENVGAQHEGEYAVRVRTTSGMTTSVPASLRLSFIVVLLNDESAVAESYSFLNGTTMKIISSFTNEDIYYTLDGSVPTSGSTRYNGPIYLQSSATVRAVAYDQNSTNSASFGPIAVAVTPGYSISIDYSAGGQVLVDPPSALYPAGATISVRAMQFSSSRFLGWVGELAGNGPTITLTVNSNVCARAMFGASLDVPINGSGSVSMRPQSTNLPYGSMVELLARPSTNTTFSHWSGYAGTVTTRTNPIRFQFAALPEISANFSNRPGTIVTLVVAVAGAGRVLAIPATNRYVLGSSVTLNAIADRGGQFLAWSSDAVGTAAVITVRMDRNKSIDATFTPIANLSFCDLSRPSAYLSFDVFGAIGDRYEIQKSFGFADWQSVAIFSNEFGLVRFSATPDATRQFYRAVILPP